MYKDKIKIEIELPIEFDVMPAEPKGEFYPGCAEEIRFYTSEYKIINAAYIAMNKEELGIKKELFENLKKGKYFDEY